jgi:site-specific recombinase XerD
MFLDKEYFDGWMQRLSERLERIEKLCAGDVEQPLSILPDGERLLDNYDLCRMLNISKRTIPLTTRAMEALKKQRVRGQEILLKNAQTAQDEYKNLVFVTRNNRPTQQFIVQECMDVTTRRIQKEHPEFERFSPHCFRHTFATRAIENGMQPKSVQKLLGHGSLQLTMDLYCHVTDDTLFDEMRKMEAV